MIPCSPREIRGWRREDGDGGGVGWGGVVIAPVPLWTSESAASCFECNWTVSTPDLGYRMPALYLCLCGWRLCHVKLFTSLMHSQVGLMISSWVVNATVYLSLQGRKYCTDGRKGRPSNHLTEILCIIENQFQCAASLLPFLWRFLVSRCTSK